MTKMSESCDELELGRDRLKLVKNGLDWTGQGNPGPSQILMTNLNFCQPVALRDTVRFDDSGPSGPRIPVIQV